MAQQGFLLIADITGYTMFLTRSELEHAQGILDTLFKSIFAEIKAPIILSNLQGDAALTYLPDANLPQRQFPLDAIERIYCSFSHARQYDMQLQCLPQHEPARSQILPASGHLCHPADGGT